ncbi:LexA family protein [Paenibacillus rubinfantis]|uniref:LexA family protein n=1 Tax=Paenibacillus rubinfantis TaxID=1720296 RepID=UPI00073F5F09|nr:helix-turn-helix domain-containing protein [Paenibacillus rubinfantis]
MNDKPLSQRQTEALEIIKSFVAQNGYPPTVREIGENLGLQSSSTAFNLLEQLVKKGYVSKGPGPRMLRVVEKS